MPIGPGWSEQTRGLPRSARVALLSHRIGMWCESAWRICSRRPQRRTSGWRRARDGPTSHVLTPPTGT